MRMNVSLRMSSYLLALGLGVASTIPGAQVEIVMAWGGNIDTSGATPDICGNSVNC